MRARKHQQGGVAVFTPELTNLPSLGGIDKTRETSVPAFSYQNLAAVFDPARTLAQREATLLRQKAAEDAQLQKWTNRLEGGYDDILGKFHNPAQRAAFAELKAAHHIKDVSDVNLDSVEDIKSQFQAVWNLKNDEKYQELVGKQEVADKFIKFPSTGLTEETAAERNAAIMEYLNNTDPTKDDELMQKLDPRVWYKKDEEKRGASARATLPERVNSFLTNTNTGYGILARVDELDDPNSELSAYVEQRGLSYYVSDETNRQAALSLGYIKETKNADGTSSWELTDVGRREIVQGLKLTADGLGLREANKDKRAARAKADKEEKADETLANSWKLFQASWTQHVGASKYALAQEFFKKYPDWNAVPDGVKPCATQLLSIYDTAGQLNNTANLAGSLATFEGCIKQGQSSAGTGQPNTTQAPAKKPQAGGTGTGKSTLSSIVGGGN